MKKKDERWMLVLVNWPCEGPCSKRNAGLLGAGKQDEEEKQEKKQVEE